MCWSAEVSLQSFLLGCIGIIVGWKYGLSKSLLFFYFTIVCMQLFEFIIWSFIDNKHVRFITSLFAALLLVLQPIAAISILYPKPIMYPLLYTYIILIGITHIYLWSNLNKPFNKFYDMYPGKNGHLIWNWLQKDKYTLLYLIIYFIFLFTPLIISKNWSFIIYGLLTLILSMYSYWKENTWGSMWCWLVNFSVILITGNLFFTSF
jgi:hypothetical protein